LVVNLRLLPGAASGGGWGIHPARTAAEPGPRLALVHTDSGWSLAVRGSGSEQLLSLPHGFDPAIFQQFRCEKVGGCLAIAWEDHLLGEIAVRPDPSCPGLQVRWAAAEVDAVRLTARP